MNIRDEVMRMKQAAPEMAASPVETRNRALERMAAALREHREDILAANAEDLAAAESAGVRVTVRPDSGNSYSCRIRWAKFCSEGSWTKDLF